MHRAQKTHSICTTECWIGFTLSDNGDIVFHSFSIEWASVSCFSSFISLFFSSVRFKGGRRTNFVRPSFLIFSSDGHFFVRPFKNLGRTFFFLNFQTDGRKWKCSSFCHLRLQNWINPCILRRNNNNNKNETKTFQRKLKIQKNKNHWNLLIILTWPLSRWQRNRKFRQFRFNPYYKEKKKKLWKKNKEKCYCKVKKFQTHKDYFKRIKDAEWIPNWNQTSFRCFFGFLVVVMFCFMFDLALLGAPFTTELLTTIYQ